MILVTAANGHLGQRILSALLKKTSAEQIIAAARNVEKIDQTADKGIGRRQADYDVQDTLMSACQSIDTLILVPSPAPETQRIQQHRNVIAAAEGNHVRTLIFVSFMDVRADSPLSYAHVFAETERILAESGLTWTNMRMPYYTDNLLHWLPESLEKGEIISAAGDGRMPYVTQADLAESIATVATTAGHTYKTYELSGPDSLNYDDLAVLGSKIYGKTATYRDLTPDQYTQRLRGLGATEYRIENALGLAAAIKQGAFDRVTNHVEQLTGHAPESVKSFFKRHAV